METSEASGDLEFALLSHQLEFGELLRRGVRHPAIIGGAGLGKTRILVVTAITLCSINVGLPMLLTEPTYAMVVDILEPAIREVCEDRDRPIPYTFRAREHAFYFPWWGSTILCRSGEKPRRLRGPNLAAAGIDEAGDQVEEVFTTLQGRVRHPKAVLRCVMAAGTPRGFNWVYERWAEPAGKRRLKNAGLVRARSYDNTFVTDADPDWIKSQKDTYDPELYKQEVEGEFVSVGQLATYYGFSRSGNLRPCEFDPTLPVAVLADFNHSPLAWVFLQPTPTGGRCIGELTSAANTDAACDEVIERFGDPFGTHYLVYGDASGFTTTTHRNYSDYEIMRERLNTAPRVNRKNARSRDRVNAVNGLLTNAAGAHRLEIDPRACPKLVRDLEQTRNIPGTLDVDGSNPDLTHWANALSFWAVMEHGVIAGAR